MGFMRTESDSSNIRLIEHHPDQSRLVIEFRDGGRYEYAGVSAIEHDEFVKAGSHGKHFHSRIKGHFQATKIE